MRKIIIAGASSHSGKTLITCGLLSSLRKRALNVIAFKTGPDYIDTEYLRRAGHCEAYNLDTWLMSAENTRRLFSEYSAGHDIAIIEGAMGLFDGGINSTADIARLIDAPVLLVINARSMGESAAALAMGFREFGNDIDMAGVILNFTGSDYHAEIISSALNRVGIKFLGALKRDDRLKIPERHLGLLSANENDRFNFEALGAIFESSVNVDEILRLSENVKDTRPCEKFIPSAKYDARVAAANDEAFTFIYPESLKTLERFGAEIVPFSPLNDERLPDADGYIFCGGYPEIFAQGLADNVPMLESVRNCRKPILAECGGMMYLCRSLKDSDGNIFDMAGVIPFEAFMSERPVMGYMTGVALRDNILCRKGDVVRGHEYHYSRILPEYYDDTCAFELTRRNGQSHYGGYSGENISASCGEGAVSASHSETRRNILASCVGGSVSNSLPEKQRNILASYLHINFYGNERLAENFLQSLTSSKG